MKRLSLYLAFLVLILAGQPSFALPQSPEEIAASEAWKSADFKEYLKQSILIEQMNKGFGASFNVVLGYFRLGKYEGARSKIANIRKLLTMQEKDSTLLAKLEAEIVDNARYQESLMKRYSYSSGGTLSSSKPRFPNTRCQGERRYDRECQGAGLSPEEAQRLMRILRGEEIARDYSGVEPAVAP